jgi:VanZ family protein
VITSLLTWLTRHRWPAWLWTFLILLACTWPGKDLPESPITFFDKIVHMGLFGGWTFLWLVAQPKHTGRIIILGLAYGIFLEFYQQWLPFDRSFDWWDIMADSAGVLAGYLSFLIVKRFVPDHRQQV